MTDGSPCFFFVLLELKQTHQTTTTMATTQIPQAAILGTYNRWMDAKEARDEAIRCGKRVRVFKIIRNFVAVGIGNGAQYPQRVVSFVVADAAAL